MYIHYSVWISVPESLWVLYYSPQFTDLETREKLTYQNHQLIKGRAFKPDLYHYLQQEASAEVEETTTLHLMPHSEAVGQKDSSIVDSIVCYNLA